MAAARRKRKPAARRSGIGAGWWLAGLMAVGWTVHSSNPALFTGLADQVAGFSSRSDSTPAATRSAAVKPPAVPQPHRDVPAVAAPVPDRKSQVASVVRPAMPATRPATAGGRAAGKSQLRLLSEPRANSTVRAAIEPGKTLRIVESKGDWRRVESGIFTGWVRAADLGIPAAASSALPTAMRPPALQRERTDRRLVPPATVGGRQ